LPQVLHSSPTTETRAGKVPTLFWFVIAAAAATVLLLLISAVSFKGLDRLLPEGEAFQPYFTT
jgi:hypothetical protein